MKKPHWIIGVTSTIALAAGVIWVTTRPSPEKVRDHAIDALKREDWRALYRLSAESVFPVGSNAEDEFVQVMTSLAAAPRTDGRIASWWEAEKTEPRETRRGYVLVMESGALTHPVKEELVIHAIRNGDRWLVQGTRLALGYLKRTRRETPYQAKAMLTAMRSAQANRLRDPVEGHCLDTSTLEAAVGGRRDPQKTLWTPCRE